MTERAYLLGPTLLEAMCEGSISKNEQKVLLSMALLVDDRNKLTARTSFLADEAEISEKKADKALSRLIDRKFIRPFPAGPDYFLNPYVAFCGDEDLLDEVLEEYDALQ